MTNPDDLALHYRLCSVQDRILLTGHSHQAWPDVSYEGHREAFEDSVRFLDDKWERALQKADSVRQGYRRLLDDDTGYYSLSANTHDLLVRFLSALDFQKRPKIITTDGEFHTVRRQLDRLNEESWVQVVKVSSTPPGELASRIKSHLDDRTSVVIVSAVFFNSGLMAEGLAEVQELCDRQGATLLVDVYHALNVVPFSLKRLKLENAFILGGGYKYCQLGEGNCFLRFPPDTGMRPLVTGWFGEWELLASASRAGQVPYASGNQLFAGATYDPTSHYRGARVFDFFEEMQLTPDRLREINQGQLQILAQGFDALDLDPKVLIRDRSVSLAKLGGFLVLRGPQVSQISKKLHEVGVYTDTRGDALRLGPAPYVSDQQLRKAMVTLGEIAICS